MDRVRSIGEDVWVRDENPIDLDCVLNTIDLCDFEVLAMEKSWDAAIPGFPQEIVHCKLRRRSVVPNEVDEEPWRESEVCDHGRVVDREDCRFRAREEELRRDVEKGRHEIEPAIS